MRNRTYRYFAGTPLYPFGYGLSYSDFRYSDLSIKDSSSSLDVEAKVSNTSSRDGDEVAEIYITPSKAGDSAIRQLAGFQRVRLSAGASQVIRFTVARPSSGIMKISVGSGQPIPEWTGHQFVEQEIKP
jgi:beta-glucosidase